MKKSLICIFVVVLQLVSLAQKNIVYSEVDNTKLRLDVYGAKEGEKKPVILCIHGGGWEHGSKRHMYRIAEQFAKQGYAAVSINYRLTTNRRNVWPAQLNDAQSAVRWIRKNSKKYGFDPDKITAFGVSAGGHLANLLGTMDTLDNSNKKLAAYSSRVNLVISCAGPTDLTKDFRKIPYRGGRDVQQVVDKLLGKTFNENRVTAKQASPIFHVSEKTVPHLLVHGVKDKIVSIEQARSYYKVLKKNKIASELYEVPDEGHGIKSKMTLFAIFVKMNQFLKQHKMAPEVMQVK